MRTGKIEAVDGEVGAKNLEFKGLTQDFIRITRDFNTFVSFSCKGSALVAAPCLLPGLTREFSAGAGE